MRLWDWSLRAWSTPGVEKACLALQDRANQSVALLLWRAWCVPERRPVDAQRRRAAIDLARPIETNILRPLRLARRSLSSQWPGLDQAVRRGVGEQIGAAELDLEQALLEVLEALSAEPNGDEDDLTDALLLSVEDWGGPPIERPVQDLVKTLAVTLSDTRA